MLEGRKEVESLFSHARTQSGAVAVGAQWFPRQLIHCKAGGRTWLLNADAGLCRRNRLRVGLVQHHTITVTTAHEEVDWLVAFMSAHRQDFLSLCTVHL